MPFKFFLSWILQSTIAISPKSLNLFLVKTRFNINPNNKPNINLNTNLKIFPNSKHETKKYPHPLLPTRHHSRVRPQKRWSRVQMHRPPQPLQRHRHRPTHLINHGRITTHHRIQTTTHPRYTQKYLSLLLQNLLKKSKIKNNKNSLSRKSTTI